MIFGAVEIPISIPAADQTLNILAQIDARTQEVGENARLSYTATAGAASQTASSFLTVEQALEAETTAASASLGPIAQVAGAHNVAAESAVNLSGRMEHLGVAGSFAIANLATGSEGGLTRLAHSLAVFGMAFGPVGLIITTFVAVAGEKLIQWFDASDKKAEKAHDKIMSVADALDKLEAIRTKQRQGPFGDTNEATDRAQEALDAINKQIVEKRAELAKAELVVKVAPDLAPAPADPRSVQSKQRELADLLTAQTETRNLIIHGAADVAQIQAGIDAEKLRKSQEALAQEERLAAERERLAEEVARTEADAEDKAAKIFYDVHMARLKEQEKFGKALDDLMANMLGIGEREVKVFDAAEKKTTEEKHKAALEEEKTYQENLKFLREQTAIVDRQQAEKSKQLASTTASIIGSTMKGLYSGGLSGGIKSLADSSLKVLGDYFTRMGETWIAASPLFHGLSIAMADPLTMGWAAAAYGTALVALGATLGAIGTGGQSSSGGGSSYTMPFGGYQSAPNMTGTINTINSPNMAGVSAKAPVTVNVTAFGKHDPTFQRELLEAISVAQRRGTTNG